MSTIEFEFPLSPAEVAAERERREKFLAEQNERDAEKTQAKEEGDIRRAFEQRPKRGESYSDLLGG